MRLRVIPSLILLAPVLIAGVSLADAQASGNPSITNENRLFQRFIQDGAVTDNLWLEGQFRFQNYQHDRVLSLSPIFAATLAEDFELGGSIGLVNVNPDDGGDQTGFTDMQVYGKVRLTTRPTQVSVGLLFDLPTGNEDKSLRFGTGKLDVGFFGGIRHDFGAVSLVGNAGMRINQDPDVTDRDTLAAFGLSRGRRPTGKTSLQLGGALLFAMTRQVSGVLEATYESERIDGMGSDLRITAGADYRFAEGVGFRPGVAIGSGGSAPHFEAIGSFYALF